MATFDYATEPLDEMEDVLAVYYRGRGQVAQKYIGLQQAFVDRPATATN